ncbi:MAG: RsbRD N-terminal domain-containing protein [Thermodesulfobacteriota bacterium]
MQLQELLIERKGEILDAWVDRVLSTYPADGSRVFKKGKDQFANPVGFAIKSALWEVYGPLFEQGQPEKIVPALEQMVQIRAVQTFAPSEAVSMAYLLKKVVREFCDREKVADLAGWQWFDEQVEVLTYTLFDLYVACRERLYQTRVAELKSGNHLVTDSGCPSKLLDQASTEEADGKPLQFLGPAAK